MEGTMSLTRVWFPVRLALAVELALLPALTLAGDLAHIDGFFIRDRTYVIEGKGLGRVEVWDWLWPPYWFSGFNVPAGGRAT
jgi:hypothetical protein